jgi:hypothetical protein
MSYAGRVAGRIGGVELHHLIPVRFACIFLMTSAQMFAVALDPATHLMYDNRWRDALAQNGRPCEYKLWQVLIVMEEIYAEHPEWRELIYDWILKAQGIRPN